MAYNKHYFQDEQILYAQQLNQIEDQLAKNTADLQQAMSLLKSLPELKYINESDKKKYYSIGDKMSIAFSFTSSAQGKCTVSIIRNDLPYRTFTTSKGLISIDLGVATSSASYTYTISVSDSIGRQAQTVLTFQHILGGVTLTSTFDNVLAQNVFTVGMNTLRIPCSISYAQEGYPRKIQYKITNALNQTVLQNIYECGNSNWYSNIVLQNVNLTQAGVYKLQLIGSVHLSEQNVLTTTPVVFSFSVISQNTIAVSQLTNLQDNLNSDIPITLSFRIVTNGTAISGPNALQAGCSLYRTDGGTQVLTKSITISSLTSGDSFVWAIGRIDAGTYRYVVTGYPTNEPNNSYYTRQNVTNQLTIQQGQTIGSSYTTDGLIAYFDPNDMDNSLQNPDIWRNKGKSNEQNDYYYFKLHNLNYNRNGWIVDADGSKMLKFTGDSYGQLMYVDKTGEHKQYSPISQMNAGSLGNSLQIVFKSRCIGNSNAVVMSCRNQNITDYGGYSLYYDRAKLSSNTQFVDTSLVEQKQTHVLFVIDKVIRAATNQNMQIANPVCTMNIYVNGVRTAVKATYKDQAFIGSDKPPMQMILNACYNVQHKAIENYGACQIKTIRIYNKPLNAQQVLNNYINSHYDSTQRIKLSKKNDPSKADIPIVRFVRNKVIAPDGTVSYTKYPKSGQYEQPFRVLNSITTKSSKDPSLRTSKNTRTNCTMWYTYLDENQNWVTKKYNDVDVYLQGTSSLVYPIKNYKIKMFKSNYDPDENGVYVRGSKNKIIPPNKSDKDGWHVKQSVYTLKCDYMEQSHKNNTPTAVFYEQVVDAVVDSLGSNGKYSYPKRQGQGYEDNLVTYTVVQNDVQVEKTQKKYRDAINGFPILLYYNENDSIDEFGTPIDYNSPDVSSQESGYSQNSNDVLVGTLMFNVDKSNDTLGFKLKVNDKNTADAGIDTYYIKTTQSQSGTQQQKLIKIVDPITNQIAKYIDGTDIELGILPCVSMQGTSNSDIPAAAAFYTMQQANIYYYKTYLQKKITQLGLTIGVQALYQILKTGKTGAGYDYSAIYNYEQYCENDGTGIFTDEYEYLSSTFQPRWAYSEQQLDKDKMSEQTFNHLTYGNLKKTIDWFSAITSQQNFFNDQNKINQFKKQFPQHFSYTYCMVYYLQMMMLIQVDNAGKNAMFDQWGDGILYPRPYDMDTQMGFNNSGDDKIHSSAQLNRKLSPAGKTGSHSSSAFTSNEQSDVDHERYHDYNTSDSRLWNTFGKVYATQIRSLYAQLRDKNVYSVQNIVSLVNSLTSDIIGESFYNKDAAAKYLSQTSYVQNSDGTTSIADSMLTKLQGNRDSRYQQILQHRIVFTDTFFKYNNQDKSQNTVISLRSNAVSAGNNSIQIGISVYSPCYVSIDVGSARDVVITAYVDQNSRYTYGQQTYQGVLFTLPMVANDKQVQITAAGNIKSINHMQNLMVSYMICGTAKKITNISVANSTMLTSLSLGSNIYLQNLNLSGCTKLQGSIDISNCVNLNTVNIANSAITSVTLPSGGSLKSFNAENCKLTSLTFNDLQFLNSIRLTGCGDISTYRVSACPMLTEINTAGWSKLTNISINDCSSVKTINLSNTALNNLSITSCDGIDTINLSGCTGDVLNMLNLSTVYGLKSLNISSATPRSGGIVLLLPKTKRDGTQWNGLQTFTANSSALSILDYGSYTELQAGVCDFKQLTNLSSLNISSCSMITQIRNLHYSGGLGSLFAYCRKLKRFTGDNYLKSTSTSASSMFLYCDVLQGINNINLDISNVTNASSMFYAAYLINAENAKYALSKMPNVQDLTTFLYVNHTITQLPQNLFENNSKIKTLTNFISSSYVTTVPSGLFDNCVNIETTDRMFAWCSNLQTVGNKLLKNCTKLKNTSFMFVGCSGLTTMFNDTSVRYDIFPNTNSITNTRGMFAGCSALNAGNVSTSDTTNGLISMMQRLPNLVNAEIMFANCKFVSGQLPNALLKYNTRLQDIRGMFAGCQNITGLPARLFNESTSQGSTTHTSLRYANGLFSRCVNLQGNILSTLLHGAQKLQNIGRMNTSYSITGNSYFRQGGMFANTKISGYEYNFLSGLTNLTDVSMLFYKGSIPGYNCGSTTAFVPSSSGNNNNVLNKYLVGTNSYVNALYGDIFSGLTKLNDVRYCFAGNTQLQLISDRNGTFIQDPNLFRDCKSSLNVAQGLFANCINLQIDAPRIMFNNCNRLSNLRSCFAMCRRLGGSLSQNMFTGCGNLQNLSMMFYGCSNLGSEDRYNMPSIPSGLFDSCRNSISNVSYMFYGCGFTGTIGKGRGSFDPDTNTYNIVSKGLLSNCTSLTTTAHMFDYCRYLKGSIPQDIFFTQRAALEYTYLTDISYMFNCCYMLGLSNAQQGIDSRNKSSIYGQNDLNINHTTDPGYFVPINWLSRCPNITNISYLFNHVSRMDQGLPNGYTQDRMLLDDGIFAAQTKIQNASHAFAHIKAINAFLTATFLSKCLNVLTDVSCIFAFSMITSVGSQANQAVFEKTTSSTAKNTSLSNISMAFYGTNSNNMTGYGPTPSNFSNLSSMNGAIYNQTKLSNYSVYTGAWTPSQSYWDTSDRVTSVAAYGSWANI